VLEAELSRVLSRSERSNTKITVNYNDPVQAPLAKGDEVGTLWLEVNDVREEIPIIAGRDVEQLPVFSRVIEAIKYLIFGATPSI
jgi:D-alanyl-D-alanine carboxypeptidase (penicillin-binding protein 5/6)